MFPQLTPKTIKPYEKNSYFNPSVGCPIDCLSPVESQQ
jgi:hypothetical protein